jgi:hypothetical protein
MSGDTILIPDGIAASTEQAGKFLGKNAYIKPPATIIRMRTNPKYNVVLLFKFTFFQNVILIYGSNRVKGCQYLL